MVLAHFLAFLAGRPTHKRIVTEITKLTKLIENDDISSIKFIIDTTSDADPTLVTTEGRYAIVGRILPSEGVFNEAAFQIKLTLKPEYPFSPPEICFLTPVYHPNVSSKGMPSGI